MKQNEISYLLSIALKSVDIGVLKAREFLNNPKEITSYGKDIKTVADIKVNDVITESLISTNYQIISEESDNEKENEVRWIIDPIDGTLNFSRNFPYSSVSISLWIEDNPIISVVKNIFSQDCYIFYKGHHTTLNGKKIYVSNKKMLKNSVIATGFPSNSNISEKNLKRIITNVQKFKKVRAIGSASLMLSYVADGTFDAYFEDEIYLWDVAAGLGLIHGSGGEFYIDRYDNSFKCKVLASNNLIFDESLQILI